MKILELVRKYGLRKLILANEFLFVLCLAGWYKIVNSEDWKGCFQALAVSIFAANAAVHFAPKQKFEGQSE